MPLSPKDMTFEAETYVSATNTAGRLTVLPRIEEFSGINPMAVTDSDNALTDDFESETPTGKRKFDPIIIGGTIQKDPAHPRPLATSAFSIIGRVPKRADYPKRKLRVTHNTGWHQTVAFKVRKNDIIEETDKILRWRAELMPAAQADADYDETGF